MKKLIIFPCLLAVLSCSKKSVVDPLGSNNCEKVANQYLKDIEAWSTDTSNKTKCEAVKKSLKEIISSCSLYTAVQRKEYEEELKNFTCD